MSAKNLTKTQIKFSELSLKNSSTIMKTPTQPQVYNLSPKMLYKKSPEIHDLLRFRDAVLLKYRSTNDAHFKNMANALTPQIEDKIREHARVSGSSN